MSGTVSVQCVTAGQRPVLDNLLQFFYYDLSQWYPVQLDGHGRYPLAPDAAYWARSDVQPYLIHAAGELAGFAVLDRELLHHDSDVSLAYFFIARRYRGYGVAAAALQQLLARHPGRWEIYHCNSNLPASRFWHKTLNARFVALQHSQCVVEGTPCQLYRFQQPAAVAAP